MKMLDIHMKARELPFRVGKTVCLATESTDRVSDTCSDVFEWHWDQVVKVIPDVHPDFIEDTGDSEEFVDWLQLNEKVGFLLVVETPVMIYRVEDGDVIGSYSWGRYHEFVVYGETMEEALVNAIKEVEAYQSECKEKTLNVAA